MPGTSKAKSPSGIEIVFEELTHKYTSEVNGKMIDYTSGTTFIHKFIPEFDPTGVITARCAKKQGVSVEELKKQWSEKGRIIQDEKGIYFFGGRMRGNRSAYAAYRPSKAPAQQHHCIGHDDR